MLRVKSSELAKMKSKIAKSYDNIRERSDIIPENFIRDFIDPYQRTRGGIGALMMKIAAKRKKAGLSSSVNKGFRKFKAAMSAS